MVRINLLPVRQVRKRELGRQTLVLFAVLLIGVFVGNGMWYSARASHRDQLARDVKRTQDDIAQLEKIIGEVQNITRDKKALEDKLQVLNTLKRGRTGPVYLLDAVASVLPKKVWLKKMSEAGGTMTFEGYAITHDDLAELMKSLQNVVWTPKGLGRVVESRPGAKRSQVELLTTGTIEDFEVSKVSNFFSDLNLKTASQAEDQASKTKFVDFAITCRATYAT